MTNHLRQPNFIIGGAPKCGTSSLYFWLNAHPECQGSRVKETFFWADDVNRFNKNCNCHNHSIEAYSQYFLNIDSDLKAFEATAHYIYHRTARNELLNLDSKPKMIFILREPSRQMLSHYSMIKFRLKSYTKDFSEYISTKYATDYVLYSENLKLWTKNWPSDRLLVITFEELMGAKINSMKKISRFLEIQPDFYESFDFEHRNQSLQIKSRFLHKFGLRIQRYVPFSIQKRLLPLYVKFNSAGKAPKEENTSELLEMLKEKFSYQSKSLDELFPELNSEKYWS